MQTTDNPPADAGKQSNPVQTRLSASFQASAQGSQSVVMVFCIGGFSLFTVGAIVNILHSGWTGTACMVAGGISILTSFGMWIKSHKSADESLQPKQTEAPAFVRMGHDEVSLSGPASFLQTEKINEILLAIASRAILQRPLPPAYGRVIDDKKGGSALIPFGTEQEALLDAKEIDKERENNIERMRITGIQLRNFSSPTVDNRGSAELKMDGKTLSVVPSTSGTGEGNS